MKPIITALIILGIVQPVLCTPLADGDLSALVESSEQIDIVRVLSVNRSTLGKPITQVTVSVLRALKGGEPAGSLVVELPESSHPVPTRILVGKEYLAFLKRSNGIGDWTVASATAIVPIDAKFVEPPSKDTTRDVLGVLHRSLDSSNPEIQVGVLRYLGDIGYSPLSFARARRLSASDREIVAAQAMIYRLKKGDEVDTSQVVSFVEQSRELSESELRELAFLAVYDASLSVAEQNELLRRSTSPNIRSVAAAALHFRGDETSVPVLLEAVSSDDPLIAVHAHEGLKRITGRDAPVLSEFKATVTDVGEDWRRWVKEWSNARADLRE